ncbi:ribosome maturation factor RimM [Paludicola sp. MB14-C6]|uniref:ribosome maturation factor RimM n=1 Tax=Paludihabitans sp. MB14-C6 TaxID=3070656 RepID=UPI0027DD32E6|nr:ribosome maturation factor RimM [Paludicola sp. MB14-C6]WMJ22286.1 ribosome maturation factor RimM [Paludicola sp. MB14-C6]
MKKQYLEIGQIVSTQGIKGEVRVQPWCDYAEFLLDFDLLYFDQGKAEVEIENARVQKNVVVMKLKGMDTVEQAQKLRNKVLFMNRDDIELEDEVYFVQDLIGLKVVDKDDPSIEYGELVEVSQTGANDVYHIKFADGSIKLIPAIPSVVITTDIENNVMEIRPLKGLFDDED